MSHRFIPLAAGVLLLAAVPLFAEDAEDQAVKAVEKVGGMVVRDDKDPAKPVVEVNLHATKVTDAGLRELAGLKRLRSLDLDDTQVTDKGLKELAALEGLQTLKLGNTQVTDAGLKELAGLMGMKSLALYGTKVTGAGLKDLAAAQGVAVAVSL